MRASTCVFIVLVLSVSLTDARRSSSSGSRSRGGSSSRSRTPSPPPRPQPTRHNKPTSNDNFLNAERGASSTNTHNRGSQFTPSAPQPPHTSNSYSPSASQPTHPNNYNPSVPHNNQFNPSGSQPSHTNGPIGFEGLSNANNKGNHPIGFDNINSQVQNRPAGNSPPYPVGPPPAYPGSTGGSFGNSHDHPPAYPGRPVNAPPSYQPNNPQSGTGNNYPNQYNPYSGQHNSYSGQQNSYSGQYNPNPSQHNSYSGQYNPYPNQHNSYSGQYNPYPNQHNSYSGQYNPYSGQQNFGAGNQFGFGHGSYSPYPGSSGNHYGNSFPGSYSYPGTTYSGSPFGGGYNGNPHYSPYNFGYSGYPGQQNNYQKQSRFGGLPIPIPIPIPIPLGGGGLFGDHSYSHHVLDSFIKSKSANSTDNSTSVFLLNNLTVAPCTTDHFMYDQMKITVLSCTAEHCTAIKLSAHSKTTKEIVHSGSITMCLENNVTVTTHGTGIVPIVSETKTENTTLCRDVPNNVTISATNNTMNVSEVTTTTSSVTDTTGDATTTDVPTTTELTTVAATPAEGHSNSTNTTRLCEMVNCWLVEMCLPTIEVVDQCNAVDCPFRRTGYQSCVKVKMCRSPSVPISTTATLNNTVSKIDEYNRFNSVYDVSNLTLISYHRPVISFNCSQNVSTPGCPPPPGSTTVPVTTPPPSNSSAPCVATNTTHPIAGNLFPALADTVVCDNSTSTTTVISEGHTAAPQR